LALGIKYVRGGSFFHRIDPLTKFIYAATVAIICVFNTIVLYQVFILIYTILVAKFAAKLRWRDIGGVIKVLLVLFIGFVIVSPLLNFYGKGNPIYQLGPLTFWDIGLFYGLTQGLRFFAIGLSSITFVLTTHPSDITYELSKHIPFKIANAFSLALVFWPVVEEETRVILTAQALRSAGAKMGITQRLSSFFKLLIVMVIRGVQRAMWVGLAMDSRGYGAYDKKTWTRDFIYPRSGLIARYAFIAVTVLFIYHIVVMLGINPWGGTYLAGTSIVQRWW
jgi:energy-coupling factor transport system permease protein